MTLASGVELWIAPCAYGPAQHLTLTIFDIRRGHFPNTAKLTANLCSVLTELRAAWGGSKEKWLALNTGPGPSGGAAGGHLRPRPLSALPGPGAASLYPRYIPANEADTIVLGRKV